MCRNVLLPFYGLLGIVLVGLYGCQTAEKQVKAPIQAASQNPAVGGSIALSGKYRTLAVSDLNNDGIVDFVGG